MPAARWAVVGAIAVALVIALSVLRPGPPAGAPGAPWQIDIATDGTTRVFGLTPGHSTLDAALRALGADMELAIVAAGDEPGSLEAYYARVTAGPVIGRMILSTRLDADTLARLRRNSPRMDRAGTGARKLRIADDDLPAALAARIDGIAFLPIVDLDEETIVRRFGEPARRVRTDARTEHLLYPRTGLDVVLSEDGREVLQYVDPHDFERLSAPLQPPA